MIAFGFENIIVFIFHFPTSSSSPDNKRDRSPVEWKISDKSVFINDFLSFGMSNRDFRPVDIERVIARANASNLPTGQYFEQVCVVPTRHQSFVFDPNPGSFFQLQ